MSILSRYSVAPWAWYDVGTSVDAILPPDPVIDLGFEPQEAPDYNAIYVTGTTQGIVGHIKRPGTAGNVVAPLITEALWGDINAWPACPGRRCRQ